MHLVLRKFIFEIKIQNVALMYVKITKNSQYNGNIENADVTTL